MCAGLFVWNWPKKLCLSPPVFSASCANGRCFSFHREPVDASIGMVTVTFELLFILGPRDMKHWAKVSKITPGDLR